MIAQGLAWLKGHEAGQVRALRKHGKEKDKKDPDWKDTKARADALDAFVRLVLGESGEPDKDGEAMTAFLFRDKNDLPVYAKALLGLELHRLGAEGKRDEVLRNIEQHLQRDDENQTAWLDLGNRGYWWRWYGSEHEAHAWYLKLLAAAKPASPQARGLAKYLLNNRRHATYWNSTRDTACCLEALGDFLRASKEGQPDMEIEVLLDGKSLKSVKITKDNLFTFDGAALVAGDVLGGGEHVVELRRKGKGALYANAYLTYFTKEDFITKAGLEVKVERAFYRLVPEEKEQAVATSTGAAHAQKARKLRREKLAPGAQVKSGDLIEVELSIDSKNDYEYLLFEDWKAAGLEAVEVRSGHNPNGLGAYMELRDEKVALFVRSLPRGRHNLSYRLRAEVPGTFSALPTKASAMYAPELRANSDEMKVRVTD